MRRSFGWARGSAACCAGFLLAALTTFAASAQTSPSKPLRVPVDKAEVLTLDAASAVVLIANPAIADVVLERNHLLFVLGKTPGATNLFVYSEAGRPLLDREIVVVPQDNRVVTITREITPTDYYCEPRCVATSAVPGGGAGAGGGAAPASAPAAAGAAPQARAGAPSGPLPGLPALGAATTAPPPPPPLRAQ
ncbi:MAG TPA: pilus assembly protein N-terminal domain-containing protein [Stellaceae bacterium]|nr:pilus assembly protein N-terminal domain-containing protein [Stellaceae bacterium]